MCNFSALTIVGKCRRGKRCGNVLNDDNNRHHQQTNRMFKLQHNFQVNSRWQQFSVGLPFGLVVIVLVLLYPDFGGEQYSYRREKEKKLVHKTFWQKKSFSVSHHKARIFVNFCPIQFDIRFSYALFIIKIEKKSHHAIYIHTIHRM